MSEDKPSRQKFKWTKELVNIALNDGMTQEEISKVCRTQQSVVSSWKNGKNKATEQQLAELLRRYGARLNRTTAKVYLVYEDPKGTWEATETGRQLLEEQEQSKAAPTTAQVFDVPRRGWTAENEPIEARIKRSREDFAESGPHRLVQVEGPVVFRYTFSVLSHRAFRRSVDLSREPIARWVLHDLHRGKFLLVSQSRRQLVGTAKRRWDIEFQDAKARASKLAEHARVPPPPMISSDYVNSTDDAGRWISFLCGPLTVEELLREVDDYLADSETTHSPHDELVLPYLIRKALVEHGHPVPGIDRITGLE